MNRKHDLKIVNAILVDGSGSPGRPGELAVRGGRIAALAHCVSGAADKVIDAAGRMVSPGFIDLHTHCMPGPCENFLQCGVTLVVGGNCGFSPLDMKEFTARCPGACGPNIAMLIGHNSVRIKAMGNVNRKPSAREMGQMRKLVETACLNGACGFSSGLTYVPGNYAETAEVIELARAAAPYGAYYTSHMRDEGAGLLDSIRETLEIAQAASMPAHISHIKAIGVKNHGKSTGALRLLDGYSAQGLDVTQDQYPYTAFCGRILLMFPAWAQEGGEAEMRARLADRAQRARLKEEIIAKLVDAYDSDGRRIVISSAPDAALGGRSLAAVAAAQGRSDSASGLAETLLEIVARFPSQTAIYCIFHGIAENDLQAFMRHPNTAVGSDAWTPAAGDALPHPRAFGSFPRVLGHYARGLGIFSMEEAVRRMTGLPAARLKLNDRGTLREGAWADIVIFDPKTVIDRATFDNPRQYPSGIGLVLVNGVAVIENGAYTGALPGVFVSSGRATA
ncbi:MAG: amidohydrolase family protein [Kiritimatiellia bacterium]